MRSSWKAALVVPAALAVLAYSPPSTATGAPAAKPNIVVILADDLSTNLVPYMSEVEQLAVDGVSFDRFFVSNSQCCPSRATFQTGQYPHHNGVLSNVWPSGGFGQFIAHGHLETSLGPRLQAAGYRTGLFGKYLNEYVLRGDQDGADAPDFPPDFVPPGWDEWWVTNDGYGEFDYLALESVDGVAERDRHEHAPGDYLTDAMADRMLPFLDRASDEPFFLMLAPFGPHSASRGDDPEQPGYLFPPAPRDRPASPNRPRSWGEPEFRHGDCGALPDGGCRDVVYPDPASDNFNVPPAAGPGWAPDEPLSKAQVKDAKGEFLERVQMVQSVDDLVGRVRTALAAAGLADTTYVVFTSDNGFHLGEHALRFGKTTAYDHDSRVPLIVVPPGGDRLAVNAITSNVDLMPTLLDIADAPIPPQADGESLVPFWTGSPAVAPRSVLIEHDKDKAPGSRHDDPDAVRKHSATPPPYRAVRTTGYLYVDYSVIDSTPPRAARAEFYWLANDPHQLVNAWATLSHDQKVALNTYLTAYAACSGDSCRALSRTAPVITP